MRPSRRAARTLRALAMAWALSACSEGVDPSHREAMGEAERLAVYVVNEPLRAMAERIGGERVRVFFPAPRGEDPAWWIPDAESVGAYQAADLIVLNGAGYARWVQLASLPQARLLDVSGAFQDRLIPLADGVTHGHGPEGDHSHRGMASTTWLDPELAIEQAHAIAEALARRSPDDAGAFQANLEALESDLRQLDARLAAVAEGIAGAPLLFSHPVYQYLIRRYDLNARSLHWEPDQMPDLEAWQQLRELLAEHPARWMLWEAPPLPESASKLADLGVESLVFDPTGQTPDEGDFLQAMRNNVATLEAAFVP